MMNAVWSKYYEAKYKGRNYGNEMVALHDSEGNVLRDENGNVRYVTEKENESLLFRYKYARFVRAMLFNYVLGALFETILRQAPDMIVGGGDDDDDDLIDLGIASVDGKKLAGNIVESATAGFPFINELTKLVYGEMFEKRYYGGRGVGVISGSAKRAEKVVKDVAKIVQGSEKMDAQDLVRDIAKLSNAKTGFSDTLTDAFFNTVRFMNDDGYSLDNMDDLREYIGKTIFDRKLQKRK